MDLQRRSDSAVDAIWKRRLEREFTLQVTPRAGGVAPVAQVAL
jgi:hypothetical protein